MRFNVVRTLLIALIVPSVAAYAQDSAFTRKDPGPWTVSLGINSMGLNLGTQRPGTRAELVGMFGRHWKLTRHVDVRTRALGGLQLPRALTLNDLNGCPGCEVWSSRGYAGANAALVYSWRSGKALRPYLLTGAEAIGMRSRTRLEAPCAADNSCEFIERGWKSRVRNAYGLGLTMGAGAEFSVKKANVFVEYSTHAVPLSASPLMPISIGFRF